MFWPLLQLSTSSNIVVLNHVSRVRPKVRSIFNRLHDAANPKIKKNLNRSSSSLMAQHLRLPHEEHATTIGATEQNNNQNNFPGGNSGSDISGIVSGPQSHVQEEEKTFRHADIQESILQQWNSPNPNLVINPVHFAYYYHLNNYWGQYAPQQWYYNTVPFTNYQQQQQQQPVLQRALSHNNLYFHSPIHQQYSMVHTQSSTYIKDNKSTMNGLRFWEPLPNPNINKPGFTFTVMSYNILAQDLLEQHPYLYRDVHPRNLNWKVRWHNLFAEIANLNPDILCLQEVQGSHIKNYISHLHTLGYQGVYKQRTGVRTDGCAIYYKHDLVTMVEHTTVEYNQSHAVPILNRDNVAIIARFAANSDKTKEFVVATTHLLYNPRRTDVRLAQCQLLLAELDRMAFKGGSNGGDQYLPVILDGDFNSTPNSELYEFITRGQVSYEHLARRFPSGSGEKTLVPASLRITDLCQHHDLVQKRKANERLQRTEEEKITCIKHSGREAKITSPEHKETIDRHLFSSGTLRHRFHLRSVYDHGKPSNPEGTTFQDAWISVDYIFYRCRGDREGVTISLEVAVVRIKHPWIIFQARASLMATLAYILRTLLPGLCAIRARISSSAVGVDTELGLPDK